jgi:thiamine-monophosphate kinase
MPRIREARWLAEHGADAAIDISDGLLADARHLAVASGVTIEIDLAALPRVDDVTPDEAATSGEEYELLVAMSAGAAVVADAFARELGIPLTAIGRAVPATGEPVRVGGRSATSMRGHDHLR